MVICAISFPLDRPTYDYGRRVGSSNSSDVCICMRCTVSAMHMDGLCDLGLLQMRNDLIHNTCGSVV